MNEVRIKSHLVVPLLLMTVLIVTACTAPAPSVTSSAPTQPAAEVSPTALASATAAAENPGAAAETPTGAVEATPTVEAAMPAGAVQYVIVPAQSEARYRIREQLVNLDLPNDAVGVTRELSGAITVNADGSIDTQGSLITVQVDSLTSDRSQRDNYVRRNVLKTSQYPTVTFTPTAVTGLPNPLPESGQVSFQVTGDLTLLDVTKPVTWDVTGEITNSGASGTATTRFTFEDFNLTRPSVPVVLSLEDTIQLEVDVTLERSMGAQSSSNVPVTGSTTAAAPAQALACTSPAALTRAMTEGPYYTANPPQTGDLYQPGMSGVKLTLTGSVLTSDCQPVAGARVDFWQADAQGVYDNTGYTLRGYQITGDDGRYHLVTVIPGLYPGRTEHIHVKVQAPGGPVLTTQLFFPGVSQNDRDGIYDASLLVQNLTQAADGMTADYNFVLP